MAVNTDVFMATRDRAAEMAGVNRSRLDYWASTGLVTPSVVDRVTPHRPIRLYGYADLLSVLIVAQLRKQNVSLQHVRAVVDRVRKRGFVSPLAEVKYAVVGQRLYFQDENGHWEDGVIDGQHIIPEVLDLRPLRARIDQASRRPRSLAGSTERRRGVLGSKEVIAGTRIPVATVERYLRAGRSDQQILDDYPALTLRDIEQVRRRVA